MADTQPLFDALAGAAGHGVDRPSLNAYVANSQARNGLVTAQTEEALNNAQMQHEEMQARGNLESAIAGTLGADGKPLHTPSEAHAIATLLIGKFGNAQAVMDAQKIGQETHNRGVLSDPANIGTPADTAAAAGISGKAPEAVALPPEYQLPPGVPAPTTGESPLGAAETKEHLAGAGLKGVQAAAGGYNPHTGVAGANLTPDQITSLNTAVTDGRLDPARINSRTASIFAQLEQRNPGQTNFNALTAAAALQRNAGFQQKSIGLESLPSILSHMTTLGKKVGYNDVRTVGKMQQWANGEFNDPDYTEYMTVRNDALMKVASLMRGVGMSDQAHQAEIQAAAPTLSPLALDAWLKGQMATLTPLLEKTEQVRHLGDHTMPNPGTPVTATPPAGNVVNFSDLK
jgi:hypothetical protein